MANIFGTLDEGFQTVGKPAAPKVGSSGVFQAVSEVAPSYFYGTTTEGGTLGKSDQVDTSGRPLLAYRKPGDTSTTTDRTRVATTFDPRKAQALTRDDYYNPRAESLRAKLKEQLGVGYSDELDHAIALTLSGSNQIDNLRPIPKADNRAAGVLETKLAREVASGEKSLFDAQIESAKAKGIDVPYTGAPEKPSFWESLSKGVEGIANDIFGSQPKKTPVADSEKSLPGATSLGAANPDELSDQPTKTTQQKIYDIPFLGKIAKVTDDAVNDATQSILEMNKAAGDKSATQLERAAKTVSALLGTGSAMVFTAPTALLQAAEDVPVLGPVVKVVNNLFGEAGRIGGEGLGGIVTQALEPIKGNLTPEEYRATIDAVKQIGSFAGQAVLGGALHVGGVEIKGELGPDFIKARDTIMTNLQKGYKAYQEMPNKQGGFVKNPFGQEEKAPEDSKSSIPKNLESLAEEARKYKSVDEFKASITPKQYKTFLNEEFGDYGKGAGAKMTGATKRKYGDYFYSQDKGMFDAQLSDVNRGINSHEHGFISDFYNKAVALPEAKPFTSIYTPEETAKADKLNLVKEVDSAIAEKRAIVVDPDKVKELAGNDYSPENGRMYSHLAELQFDHALTKSKNPIVKFIVGGPGSGKSEVVAHNLAKGFDGIVYDAPNSVAGVLDRRIAKAEAAGKTPVVHLLIADPLDARAYALQREIITGRSTPLDYHVKTHMAIPEIARHLIDQGVEVFIKDVRGLDLNNALEKKWISAVDNPKEALDIVNSAKYDKKQLTQQTNDVKLSEKQVEKAQAAKQRAESQRAGKPKPAGKPIVSGGEKPSGTDRQVEVDTSIGDEKQSVDADSYVKALTEPIKTPADARNAFLEYDISKPARISERTLGSIERVRKEVGLNNADFGRFRTAYFGDQPLRFQRLSSEGIPLALTRRQRDLARGSRNHVFLSSLSEAQGLDLLQAMRGFVKDANGKVKIPTTRALMAPEDIAAIKLADRSDLKDITGFKGQSRDVYRNFKHVFGTKFPEAEKVILDPFDRAKGEYVDVQKELLDSLKKNVVDKYGIKKGSKESRAVMDYGEGLKLEKDIANEFGPEKARDIVTAAEWFRKQYDTLLDKVNESRKKVYPNNPDKLIPKRKDYFRHFTDLSAGFEGLKNIFETPAAITPQLAGLSEFTVPKSKFLSFAQRRLGLNSARDAVGGFLNYIPSAAYATKIDPQIGKFRNLAKELAIKTEKSRHLNNFIEFLQDYANDLSGKTNPMDRYLQKVIPGGRKTFKVIDWVNRRIKANVVLGNLSSTIAQIFNVPQGVAEAKLYSLRGATKSLGQVFTENTPMKESNFIKERYHTSMYNNFDVKWLDKPKQFAAWMTGVLDEVGTKFIWNSMYEKAIGEKIADPVGYADKATRRMVAGRGVGEVPLLQKSKIMQLVAPFQLEVANAWHVMGDMVKAKDFGGIATFFAVSFLMNQVAKQIRGSDVVFDPIQATLDGIATLQAEEDKKKGALLFAGRLAGEVLSNLPGGQTLAATYPENGFGGVSREQLFGEGDPTRFGSGVLLTKGLQDPLFKIAPPFAGNQLGKSVAGILSVAKGEETGPKGKLKYKIAQTPRNFVQAAAFGKSAIPEAQKYYDEQGKKKPEEKATALPGGAKLPPLPKLPKLTPLKSGTSSLPALPKLPKLSKPSASVPFSVKVANAFGIKTAEAAALPQADFSLDDAKKNIAFRETGIVPENKYAFSIPSGDGKTRDLGKYQVNENTLASYGKRFLGSVVSPEEFLASSALQERFVEVAYNHLVSQGVKTLDTMLALWKGGWGDISKTRIAKLKRNPDIMKYIRNNPSR